MLKEFQTKIKRATKEEKAFLDSLDIKFKERICEKCGYEWIPNRLSSFHCPKCHCKIGLSPQAKTILEKFYKNKKNGEIKMPLSEKEKALIKDLSKDLDDLVTEKLAEHLPKYVNKTFGGLAGRLLNLGVDKFFPYFEEKLNQWNPETLDFSRREGESFKIAGCSPEESEMIAGLFGVHIPLKPVPPPSPKRPTRIQKVATPPVIETETYQPTAEEENLIISTLKKIAKEDLEYYIESKEVGINSLLFLALPHLRKLSKEQKEGIQDIDLEFVRGLIEQVRPDLYEIIERKNKDGKKEGIIWLRIFIKKAKELCKDEPIDKEET